MSKPIAKHTLKVMEYIKKHPNATAFDVAMKFNMHKSRIYQLRKRIKDEEATAQVNKGLKELTWTVSSVDDDDTPGPTPEHEAQARASSAILDAKRTQKELEERLQKYFPGSVDAVLNERGNRYGTFESNAKTCQLLKNVLHAQDGWYRLSYVQREAVEMIMHKISRLVNGDGTYLDTVVDISGYNQLMLDHMRGRDEDKKVE